MPWDFVLFMSVLLVIKLPQGTFLCGVCAQVVVTSFYSYYTMLIILPQVWHSKKEKHKEMRRNVAVYSNNWNSWFLICLALMYLTDLGVRGIRRYDSSFHSPDMKFHYSVKQVMETFERIGETGRLIYQKYLILDCLFTLFFSNRHAGNYK